MTLIIQVHRILRDYYSVGFIQISKTSLKAFQCKIYSNKRLASYVYSALDILCVFVLD